MTLLLRVGAKALTGARYSTARHCIAWRSSAILKTPSQKFAGPLFYRLNSTQGPPHHAKVISYEDILSKTRNPSPSSYLIDVREPDEVAQGMIPSAVNVPLSVLDESLRLPPDQFAKKFGFNKPAKERAEVTFYCRAGVRSATASEIAEKQGWKNILNYKGSWLEWTEKSKKS